MPNLELTEIVCDYVDENGFLHFDGYFLGTDQGETLAVIYMPAKAVYKFLTDFIDHPMLNEAIQKVLSE